MTERIFSHWPARNPIPPNTELVSTFPGQNHGRYSVLIEHFAEDTGYEGVDIAPIYGFSLPDPLPLFRKVYIDALTEPGLRAAPNIATGIAVRAGVRRERPASEIRAARSE